MKQQLWILNSSLVAIFLLSLNLGNVLRRQAPVVKPYQITVVDIEKKKDEQQSAPVQLSSAWEKIYQDDIFDTYAVPETKTFKQSFVTPIPDMKPSEIVPPPEPKKQEFVPPLGVILKGIIISSDHTKNAAMIADETNKESLYHLGDTVKDAQIIKIAKNRVVFLRANGQQEVFFLRKDDNIPDPTALDRWKYIVKKINEQLFEVDPQEFTKEIETLGHFLERTAVIGVVFDQGIPQGIRVGTLEQNSIGGALGLAANDIIISINDVKLAEAQSRLKAYESAIATELGGQVKVTLKRAGRDVTLMYKLVKIEKPRKYSTIPGVRIADQPQQPQPGFPMNKIQQREDMVRNFNKTYDGSRQQQAIMDIRKRLLENLHNRILSQRNR